jgi:hypothetical protein
MVSDREVGASSDGQGLDASGSASALTRRWIRTEHQSLRWRLGERKRRRWDLNEVRRHDDEENARTTPGEDEAVHWPTLWMAEIYGPTTVQALTDGLKRMGLPKRMEPGARGLLESLERGRVGRGGGWVTPGHFKRAGGKPNPGAIPTDLPVHFDSAQPFFFHVGGGVTVMIIGFHLAEDASDVLNRLLNQWFTGDVRPEKSGQWIVGADRVKEEAIGGARDMIRSDAQNWIRRRMPGAYAAGLADEFPTWDLLITAKDPLFGEEAGRDWRETLGFGFVWDRWQSRNLSDLALCVPSLHDHSAKPKPAFTGVLEDLLSLCDRPGGWPPGLAAVAHELVSDLPPLLAYWTLLSALEDQDQRFAKIRDDLGRRQRWRAGKALRRLEEQVLPGSFDLQAIARAAKDVDTRRYLGREAPRFESAQALQERSEPPADPVAFFDRLAALMPAQADTILSAAHDIVSATQTKSDILLARVNLRLQHIVLLLTVAVIGLTILGLLLQSGD